MNASPVRANTAAAPRVRVILTLADLYRRHRPELPALFAAHWRRALAGVFDGEATVSISPVVHDRVALAVEIAAAENEGCECLCLLPMTYTPSGELIEPLLLTRLPLLVLSCAWDAELPYDMGADHLLRNQAMHGVMDLTNALRRHGRPFGMVAGHPAQSRFVARVREAVHLAAGARALRTARIGQVGAFFPGMLDFTYDAANQDAALGFETVSLDPKGLVAAAAELAPAELAPERDWVDAHCRVDEGLSDTELDAGLRIDLALRNAVRAQGLDGVGLSFLSLLESGAQSLPFLGADRLMAEGKGYAGEGDVLTVALQVALHRAFGETGFTEWFCPDYGRDEVLLSHMGECNLALAHPAHPVLLKARAFAWGECQRIPVPVFQMRPGPVTVVSLSEAPASPDGGGFQLLAVRGELVEAPAHEELLVPYSRVKLNGGLDAFLEGYSHAGGTHHAALLYGDRTRQLRSLTRFAGLAALEVA